MPQEQKIEELAVRLDKVYEEIDPYNYRDADGSVEQAKEALKNDPWEDMDWQEMEIIDWK